GNGDRPVGKDLEQERLELVVGSVDLVDEQDRRYVAVVRERSQQWTLHEETLGVQLVLVDAFVARLHRAQVEELTRVIPLVDGLRRVDSLVALQPHELATRPPREDLGDLRLSDPCLTLEQQRSLQPEREEDRRRETLVGQILMVGQALRDLGDSVGNERYHPARLPARRAALRLPPCTISSSGPGQWSTAPV